MRFREVPVGGPESHGAQARSPFQGRNGTAPTGEAASRKETFLRPYAAYAKFMFLPKEQYTWNEIPPRAAKLFDYFGSAVVSRGVNRTLLRATSTCSKKQFPKTFPKTFPIQFPERFPECFPPTVPRRRRRGRAAPCGGGGGGRAAAGRGAGPRRGCGGYGI